MLTGIVPCAKPCANSTAHAQFPPLSAKERGTVFCGVLAGPHDDEVPHPVLIFVLIRLEDVRKIRPLVEIDACSSWPVFGRVPRQCAKISLTVMRGKCRLVAGCCPSMPEGMGTTEAEVRTVNGQRRAARSDRLPATSPAGSKRSEISRLGGEDVPAAGRRRQVAPAPAYRRGCGVGQVQVRRLCRRQRRGCRGQHCR